MGSRAVISIAFFSILLACIACNKAPEEGEVISPTQVSSQSVVPQQVERLQREFHLVADVPPLPEGLEAFG